MKKSLHLCIMCRIFIKRNSHAPTPRSFQYSNIIIELHHPDISWIYFKLIMKTSIWLFNFDAWHSVFHWGEIWHTSVIVIICDQFHLAKLASFVAAGLGMQESVRPRCPYTLYWYQWRMISLLVYYYIE